ncbi:MAG: choice-of-anchor tandem repeat GloVer-containing protein [Candidatus Sulfotelmatobacter sp.]
MTTLPTLGLFSLATTRSPKHVGASGPCFAKAACIAFAFCVATAIASPAQTFTSLLSFDVTNGANPQWAPLVQGTDGNLYGTASGGGIFNSGCFRSPDGYCGTVFKITPAGTLTTLHFFTNGEDGSGQASGLVLATNGNFYGVNSNGGNLSFCFGIGCGAAFIVTPGGTLTTLLDFTFGEGVNPDSALVQGTGGNLIGTTVNGGISGCGPTADGCGTIFKMTPGGTLTVLHKFDFTDGWDPQNTVLTQGVDANFYGETTGGGKYSNCAERCGTVFMIGSDGDFTLLHSFKGTDGYNPTGGLVQATDGNFYGATYSGGANGDGTVFKMTPGGAVTTLHSFNGTDGVGPYGGLVLATDGNFYGTTSAGGASGDGTVFEITPAGTLTTLHNFDGTDGADTESALLQATNGTFYGTTLAGGTSGNGTIFSLSTGLGPFVTFLPAARPVGGVVQILGQGFTGTTGVSFNGTAASFTVESDTYLTATVPAGASTGSIIVTEPGGTLTSNKTFRVVPQITSFSPTSGPVSTSVVITGESFIGVIDVHFGNVKVTSFTVDSATQITATVPAGAETGKISVCTSGGSGDSATSFTVTP